MEETSLLPDPNIDWTGLVTEGVTYIGGIIGLIVAASISFLAVKWGMKWFRKIA